MIAPAPQPARPWAAWLARYELPILLLAGPAFLFPTPAGAAVLGLPPILWLARYRATGRVVPRTPFDAALLALLIMVLVSLFATADLVFSLGKIAGVLWGIGLYYALIGWAGTPRRLAWTVGGNILLGGGVAAVGLLATDWQLTTKWAVLPRSLGQVLSGNINPNETAGALVLVVPLQIALLFATWPRRETARRVWLGWGGLAGITGLCLLTLALTGSRSALLGLVAAAFGGAALAWPRARRWVAGIGLLTTGAVILISVQGLAAHESQSNTLTSAYTLRQRLAIWEVALPVVADFPYTGTGMNGFRRVLPLFYPESGTLEGQEIPHAHNQLLQAALDLGLPGLIAYLAIWLLVPVVAYWGWQATHNPLQRALIAGLGLSLLAGFVFGFTDAVALGAKPGILFWTALALLVAAGMSARSSGL